MTNEERNIQYALERWYTQKGCKWIPLKQGGFTIIGKNVPFPMPTINHKFFAELPMDDREAFYKALFSKSESKYSSNPIDHYDTILYSKIEQLLEAYWEANHEMPTL